MIELTEHEVFGGEGELEAELAALRARGAQVALDDAGAGYAGLQQMIRIAPDILKLDRALVHGAHADAPRQALLEALIGFASTTGAAICAEGVEDLDDLHALVSLDVTYAQGYGLARPGAGVARSGRRRDRARARPRSAPACASRRTPRGAAGAFARGIAELSDELAAATKISDLGAAHMRAAELLGADDVSLMRVDRATDELELLSDQQLQRRSARAGRSPTSRRPSTCSTTASRARSSPATRPATRPSWPSWPSSASPRSLIVPVVFGGRELAVLEVYRVRPQAFTAREVDRARVLAQQFGAALDRLLYLAARQ